MHFIIDKQIFLNHLNILQKGLPIKTPLPVLNSIKVEVYEDSVLLTSSNSDLSIKTMIEAPFVEIKATGLSAIPGKFLLEIVKKIESSKIEVQTDGNQNIIIKADRSNFNLKLMDVNDYPNLTFLEDNKSALIDAEGLKKVIRQTAFAASEDEKRPILTGVNIYNKNKTLYFVATNGFRLSQKRSQDILEGQDVSLVIPKKSLDELQKILLEIGDIKQIKFTASKTHALFSFSNILFQTRLFEGQYPDTEKVIPSEFLVEIPFNKNELVSSVEKVSLLSPKEKDKYNVVRLILTKEKTVMLLSINSEIGEATDVIIPAGEIKGNDLDICFSSKYLIEALRACMSSEVKLSFINSKKAFVIEGKDDKDLTQVILPISNN